MLNRPSLRTPIAVSLGAIAGSLCRYYLGGWLATVGGNLPLGIFIINVTGCGLMGVMVTLAANRTWLSPDGVTLLTTGLLGSYTTFSGYELNTFDLLMADQMGLAIAYWLGSLGIGYLGLTMGMMVTRWLVPPSLSDR